MTWKGNTEFRTINQTYQKAESKQIAIFNDLSNRWNFNSITIKYALLVSTGFPRLYQITLEIST